VQFTAVFLRPARRDLHHPRDARRGKIAYMIERRSTRKGFIYSRLRISFSHCRREQTAKSGHNWEMMSET
jgi:hypothetical protein